MTEKKEFARIERYWKDRNGDILGHKVLVVGDEGIDAVNENNMGLEPKAEAITREHKKSMEDFREEIAEFALQFDYSNGGLGKMVEEIRRMEV